MRLQRWLLSQEGIIAARWHQELLAGSGGPRDDSAPLLRVLANHLVSILTTCFGDKREAGLEVWEQAAHLYGSVAVRRGLAAGEVVEELQLLRNVILRLFLAGAPGEAGSLGESGSAGELPVDGGREGLPPMELLALNRVLDRGVSRASVAYTDDLFFAHIQGSGVPEGITPELEEETERQLQAFRRELGLG